MQRSMRLALTGALVTALVPALLLGVLPAAASASAQSAALTPEALANATYSSEYATAGEITLVDGQAEEEIAPGSASKLVVTLIEPTAFGDLNGDGVDDAAVLLASNSGGSGTFIDLHAVLNEAGEPVDAASTLLGDRVQVNSLTIADGQIVVDMITQGPDDPMCCPTQPVQRTYVLEGDELVLTEEVELPAEETAEETPETPATGVFQPDAEPLAATLALGGARTYWLNPTLVSILGGVAEGPAVKASTLGATCAGFVAEQPDVVLDWTEDATVATLRIFMLSLGDPTLVVVTPSGDVLCSDDYSPLVADPYVSIDAPETGRYAIYAGAFEDAAMAPGFLVITSHDFNPAVMDLAQMFPRHANPDAVRNPQPAEAMEVDSAPQVIAEEPITPDSTPITQALTAGGALGAFDVQLGNEACTGFVTARPTFTFDWEGEAEHLALFFEAGADTTLIVRDPDGAYQCADDLDGADNLNPYLELDPLPGTYRVWVGSYAPDVAVDGTLTVTDDAFARPTALTLEMASE